MDKNKRRTLKLMAGVSTASMGVMTAAGSGAYAAGLIPAEAVSENNCHGQLKIQIITGRTAPEDTVIIINDTSEDVLVSEFLPGLITQNNHMIDLNSLLTEGDIIVKPGYPVASKAARWELLALDSDSSYLWCDTAVSRLHKSDTGIININAAIVNGRAMLTAVHEDLAYS